MKIRLKESILTACLATLLTAIPMPSKAATKKDLDHLIGVTKQTEQLGEEHHGSRRKAPISSG